MQRLEWHCHTKSVSGALYKAILYHGQSARKEMANSAVFNFPDRSWKGIPGRRRSGRKRAITNGGSTCRWYDECRRRSRPETWIGVELIEMRLDRWSKRGCVSRVQCSCTYRPTRPFRSPFIYFKNLVSINVHRTVIFQAKLHAKITFFTNKNRNSFAWILFDIDATVEKHRLVKLKTRCTKMEMQPIVDLAHMTRQYLETNFTRLELL